MPSVRFNESVTVLARIKPASDMTEQEHRRLWVQAEESENSKLDAHRLATAVRHCHNMDRNNPLSYTNCLSAVYEACQGNTSPDVEMMRRLVHWVGAGPNRRGIERYNIESMQQHRKKSIAKHSKTLLSLQRAMSERNVSNVKIAMALSKESMKSSKRDRLFSLVMGSADRACVELERKNKEPPVEKTEGKREPTLVEVDMHLKSPSSANNKQSLAKSDMDDRDSPKGRFSRRARKSRKDPAQ